MEKQYPSQKDYLVPVTIFNDTDHQISQIKIIHRSNDKNWDKPSVVTIQKLSPGEKITIKDWPFGEDAPSKTSNIFFNFIPLIGNIIAASRGWGKDYWSIYCKGSLFTRLLTTDTWAQRWYANVFKQDIKKGVTLAFNWNETRSLYWVSIDRKSNGQSARYLDFE